MSPSDAGSSVGLYDVYKGETISGVVISRAGWILIGWFAECGYKKKNESGRLVR